eukprot:7086906-Prorocentrum_lima.AAC.1
MAAMMAAMVRSLVPSTAASGLADDAPEQDLAGRLDCVGEALAAQLAQAKAQGLQVGDRLPPIRCGAP